MAQFVQQGAAPDASAFDAPVWLASWTDHGGIAFRTPERLWIGRRDDVDTEAACALNRLRAAIWRPNAAQALAAYMDARQTGEAFA